MIPIPTRDGIELAAEVHLPEGVDPSGTVAFVHGFGGNRHESNGLFDALAAQTAAGGLRSIVYDWRGCGDSQGDFPSSTIQQHTDDFEDVLRWIREHHTGEQKRLHIVGFSLGAAIAGIALRRGSEVDRAVYLSPAVRPNISMWPRYDTPDVWGQIVERGVAQKPGSETLLGRPILESLRDTDLGPDAFHANVPLLVCHGTGDTRIDPACSRELAQNPNPDQVFRYVEFDDASHSFRPPEVHWDRLAIEILSWLRPAGGG